MRLQLKCGICPFADLWSTRVSLITSNSSLHQIDYTNRILKSIQNGLLLEVRETGIYALRQDRCHVFASTSDPSVAHPDPRKLPQNTLVELLSFEKYVNGKCGSLAHLCEQNYYLLIVLLLLHFIFTQKFALWNKCFHPYLCSELKQFKENNGGSPDYTINMCFGEKFPDGKPLEKKLIVVKVTLFPISPELPLTDTCSIELNSLQLCSF